MDSTPPLGSGGMEPRLTGRPSAILLLGLVFALIACIAMALLLWRQNSQNTLSTNSSPSPLTSSTPSTSASLTSSPSSSSGSTVSTVDKNRLNAAVQTLDSSLLQVDSNIDTADNPPVDSDTIN